MSDYPTTPHYSKRKAEAISTGAFLICIGILFYTDKWWPGILFAIGITCALRQYLRGEKFNLFFTLFAIGLLALLTIAGSFFSGFFPLLFIGIGLYIIGRETLLFKGLSKKEQIDPTKQGHE